MKKKKNEGFCGRYEADQQAKEFEKCDGTSLVTTGLNVRSSRDTTVVEAMIDYAESWQTVTIHTCPAAPTPAQEAATLNARSVSTQCKKGNGYKRKARAVLLFFFVFV